MGTYTWYKPRSIRTPACSDEKVRAVTNRKLGGRDIPLCSHETRRSGFDDLKLKWITSGVVDQHRRVTGQDVVGVDVGHGEVVDAGELGVVADRHDLGVFAAIGKQLGPGRQVSSLDPFLKVGGPEWVVSSRGDRGGAAVRLDGNVDQVFTAGPCDDSRNRSGLRLTDLWVCGEDLFTDPDVLDLLRGPIPEEDMGIGREDAVLAVAAAPLGPDTFAGGRTEVDVVDPR